MEWRLAAGQGYPKKHRLKPYLGETLCSLHELRSLAAGRLVRWRSLDLDLVKLRAAVAAEIQLWVWLPTLCH